MEPREALKSIRAVGADKGAAPTTLSQGDETVHLQHAERLPQRAAAHAIGSEHSRLGVVDEYHLSTVPIASEADIFRTSEAMRSSFPGSMTRHLDSADFGSSSVASATTTFDDVTHHSVS